jgi:hypothetical protein
MSRDAQAEILRVDEVSDDWNRCCCSPFHPLRLDVREYTPTPGDNMNSDYAHLSDDVRNQFKGFMTPLKKREALKAMYLHRPVLFSILRNDGERCCFKCPCKLLSSFVCCACCQDGAKVYMGGLEDPEGKERGRPYSVNPNNLIGSIIQVYMYLYMCVHICLCICIKTYVIYHHINVIYHHHIDVTYYHHIIIIITYM